MKRVVIIGGGFAGATLARSLEHDFDVTLVDTKDYFEFTPSILRTIIEPEHRRVVQRCHKDYLKKARFIKGHVRDVTPADVVFDHARIPYDYLAICSGSTYSSPIKEEDLVVAARGKELIDAHKKLEHATHVLVVGGGVVGVELAAEIVDAYPHKHVTIVHEKGRLMHRSPPKAQQYVHDVLSRKNVTLLLNERVVEGGTKNYTTDKGTRLHADIAFMCTGILPNSSFMKKHFAHAVNERNQIMVEASLNVKGQRAMFALGDVTDIKEEKLAQVAEEHAHIVAHNIHALEQGTPLRQYRPRPRTMIISLGKHDGILVHKNTVITGIIPGLLKTAIEIVEMRKYGRHRNHNASPTLRT